jgi:hypothetical protein
MSEKPTETIKAKDLKPEHVYVDYEGKRRTVDRVIPYGDQTVVHFRGDPSAARWFFDNDEDVTIVPDAIFEGL